MKNYSLGFIYFVLVCVFSFLFLIPNKTYADCMSQCGSYLGNSCSTDSVSCGGASYCDVSGVYSSGNLSCTSYTCDCRFVEQGRTVSCSGDVNDGNLVCNYGSICQTDVGIGRSSYVVCTDNGGSGASCNNNNICEAGENNASCPRDCPPPPPPTSYYSVSVSPSTRSLTNGEVTSFIVTINPTIDPVTGLGNGRAVGTYVLPTPIPGCPTGASCTYSGTNTMTVTQDTTSGGVDFAVPASKTVLVNALNVAPNTYTLTFSALNSANQTQSATANLIVNAGVNNASCTNITVPTSVTTGQSFTALVTMENTGTSIWTPAGTNNYHITVSPWASTWNWGRAPVTTNVTPGHSATLSFTLTAPSTPGTYNLSTQMLQENIQWFGAVCNGGNITVTAPAALPPVVSVSAAPSTATAPGGTTVTWSATNNPTSCTASGGYGSSWTGTKASSGTMSVSDYPAGSYMFWLTCTNSSGSTTNGGVFTVSATPSPITVSISPYFTSITNYPTINNNSIYWTTTGNPDSCTASGSAPWGGSTITPLSSGSQYQGVYPGTGTYTYSITCRKAGVADVSSSISVSVAASATKDTVTVIKPIGGVIGTTDGNISCGSTCSYSYDRNSVVTFIATPSALWRFVGWTGACTGTGNCTITIDSSKSLSASFKPRSLLYQEF